MVCLFAAITSQAADRICVRASKVLIGKNLEPDRVVIINNGVIEQVRPWHESIRKQCATLSEEQGVLSPGLVDIHIHGAGGSDTMDAAASPGALRVISTTLLKEGVTTWLPTTTSASPEKLSAVLASIAQFARAQNSDEAKIAGIHMEGPFISKDKSGCHPHSTLMPIDLNLQKKWLQASQNSIRIITFAPELEHSENLVKWCKQNNIVPSIGHTSASERDIAQAISNGAGLGTHLYNAMSQTNSRDAGAAMSILENQSLPFEIILDGVHLSEPLVRIAWHLSKKHPERFILITDAMRAKGLPDTSGTFMLGDGIRVRVSGSRAVLADNPNTLAGSVLTLPFAIETMQRITDCSLAEALIAATYNPAKVIHMESKIGRLASGLAADMVLFSDTRPLAVKSVWRNGHAIKNI